MTARVRRGRAAVALALSWALVAALAGCSADPRPQRTPQAVPTTTVSSPSVAPPASSREATKLSAQEQDDLDNKLIAAAWKNDVPRARALINAGADVNHKDDSEQSAYLIATSEGYLDLLELTLRHGGDVRSLDGFRGTGLIRAADRGHAHIVGRLLQTEIDVDHVNNLGWTALHEAIILGNGSQRYVDTVRLLVAGGADVELAPARDGIPPIQHARSRGYAAITSTLRGALDGRPPRDPDRSLLRAAAAGNANGVAAALRAGADLETRDARRRTPLLLAAANDRQSVARLLVALGSDPDALDDRHDTPWLVTGVTGSVEMADLLLTARPDLTIPNRFGGTSLIPASERGHVGYVRRVVRTHIDVNHVNDLGWTALLEAVILGDGSAPYQQIVRVLLGAGADPSIGDKNGVTALEHARSKGHREIARILQGG
jgi:uncharacterized protein